MEIKDIIRQKRLEKGLTMKELSVMVGVSEATVSRWESGDIATMKQTKIGALAKSLGLSPAVFVKGVTAPTATPSTPVTIKVLGTVAAGVPMYAAENIIDEEEISAEMARDGEYFGLVIKGQSMEPKLYEGDVVIVRKQDYIENGETAIILINGDEATCKLVKEMPDGIMLIGHNTAVYEPHFYSRGEIEKLPVRVIGKVVELRRKF